MSEQSIGERLYQKIIQPVYSDDGRFYVGGCVCCGAGGSISVRFIRYEVGRGIVGSVKPSREMVGWLKDFGPELKEFINRHDAEWEKEKARQGKSRMRARFRAEGGEVDIPEGSPGGRF